VAVIAVLMRCGEHKPEQGKAGRKLQKWNEMLKKRGSFLFQALNNRVSKLSVFSQ